MFNKTVFLLSTVGLLAVTAHAGQVKIHDWPTAELEFPPVSVCHIGVIMDIGYWIECVNQNDKLKLGQDDIHEYSGCMTVKMRSNFNAQLSASIAATGAVSGSYSITKLDPSLIQRGATDVELCVKLGNAHLGSQPGASTDVHVATVTIKVVPASGT